MAFEKRREGQRSADHGLGGREARIARVHIAEMHLAFIRDCGAAEQGGIAVEDGYAHAALGQGDCGAATLHAATQDSNMHRYRLNPFWNRHGAL
jgi:hypothetical protein